jgi:hypothetical protein
MEPVRSILTEANAPRYESRPIVVVYAAPRIERKMSLEQVTLESLPGNTPVGPGRGIGGV